MAGEPQGGQQQTNDVLEITPEMASKKIKLVVDGEPKFATVSEIIKEAQIGTAASKRMQDVATEREKLKSRLQVVDLLEKGLREEDPDTIYQGLVPLVGEEKAYKAVYGARQETGQQQTREPEGDEVNPQIAALQEEVTALKNSLGKVLKSREEETTQRTQQQRRADMDREIQSAIDGDELLSAKYKRADDDGRGLILETVTSAIARRLKAGEFSTFGPAAIRAGLTDAKKRLRAAGVQLDDQPPSPGVGSASVPLSESVHLSSDAQALIGAREKAKTPGTKVNMASPDFETDILSDLVRNIRG